MGGEQAPHVDRGAIMFALTQNNQSNLAAAIWLEGRKVCQKR